MATVVRRSWTPGRRPVLGEPRCLWAGLAAQVLDSCHAREVGVVASDRRSVVGVLPVFPRLLVPRFSGG